MILSTLAKNLRSRDWGAALIEIGIVVLGILIAVQVEQYRQFRSDRDTERNFLSEIASDLQATRSELLGDRENLRQKVIEINRLLTGLTTASEDPVLGNAATLAALLSQERLSPKKSGYENLLNIGLSIISDPSLRKNLTYFYEVQLPNAISYNDAIETTIGDQLLEVVVPSVRLGPFLSSEATSPAEDDDFPVRVTQIVGIGDVRKLAHNPIFTPLLHYRELNFRNLVTEYNEAVEVIDELLGDIQTQLAAL